MSSRTTKCLWLTLSLVCSVVVAPVHAVVVDLVADSDVPQVGFAAREIQGALESRGHHAMRFGSPDGIGIILGLRSEVLSQVAGLPEMRPEGYSIRVASTPNKTTYWVIGADPAGMMYGGLEVAEIIRVEGLAGIKDVDQNPYMAMRGTKFNCPLDVRTPRDNHVWDAAQHNNAEMWRLDVW